MSNVKQIALVFPVFGSHLEPIIQGIIKYATERERNEWRFAYNPESPMVSLKGLQRWRGDGIIALEEFRQMEKHTAGLLLPALYERSLCFQ